MQVLSSDIARTFLLKAGLLHGNGEELHFLASFCYVISMVSVIYCVKKGRPNPLWLKWCDDSFAYYFGKWAELESKLFLLTISGVIWGYQPGLEDPVLWCSVHMIGRMALSQQGTSLVPYMFPSLWLIGLPHYMALGLPKQ